jgi:transcriptional regulator with XRE-family HTH domain
MSSGSVAARKVGVRIREERRRLGISQMDMAYLAGMNVANVGRIERGEGNPTLETLVRISAILDVGVSDLVADILSGDVSAGRRAYTAAEFLREKESRQSR